MKILEINKFNFPNGGADRHFLDLVQLLEKNGNEVAVFSMEHSLNEFSPWKKYFLSYVGYNRNDSTLWQKIKGVCRMFYSFEAKRKIGKILDDFQPDIVHIHNIYYQISPSILPEIKKRGIPIVMTVHDYSLICPDYLMDCNGKNWEEIKKGGWFQFIKNRCFKNSYLKSFLSILVFNFHKYLDIYEKNIDLYITPSRFTKKFLAQNGVLENKIIVLPHFYTGDISHKKTTIDSGNFALYAGRVSEDKGIGKMVKSFEEIGGVSVKIAGKKDENLKLDESATVKYLGFLSRRELSRYIDDSMFVVSFSRLPETFGLLALEAISHGKPFLGLDAGAYKEIISDGQEGYICRNERELSEKIKIISTDEKLRALLSRNALKRSKEFNEATYYSRIIREFELIKENKKALDLF